MIEFRSDYLRVDSEVIRYSVAGEQAWQQQIADTAIIGTFTNESGPWAMIGFWYSFLGMARGSVLPLFRRVRAVPISTAGISGRFRRSFTRQFNGVQERCELAWALIGRRQMQE